MDDGAISYKPALLGARCEVRVDAQGARARRGGREQGVRFADVTGVRLVEVSTRTSSTSLVLLHPGGKFVLQYGGRLGDAAHDREAAGFVRAGAAVLEGLVAVQPEARVSVGGGVGLRASMAGLGVATIVLGLLFLVLAVAEGAMNGMERAYIGVLALGMAAGGAAMAARFNPFRAPDTVTAAELAAVMRAALGAGDGGDADAAADEGGDR